MRGSSRKATLLNTFHHLDEDFFQTKPGDVSNGQGSYQSNNRFRKSAPSIGWSMTLTVRVHGRPKLAWCLVQNLERRESDHGIGVSMIMLIPDGPVNLGDRRTYARRDAIASRGAHYSAFDQFVGTFCTGLLIKTVYIVCLTTLTMSLIIECILINLVILPYLRESYFEEATCYLHYIEPDMPMLRCENKCSKDRSQFPCLKVHALYEWENRNHSAKLFDTIGTHENYKKYGCVTSTCYRRPEDNKYVVELFRMRLLSRAKFRCFVSGKYRSREALLEKFHRPQTIFHSAFWPTLVFFVSFVLLLVTLFFHRYRSWKHHSVLLE